MSNGTQPYKSINPDESNPLGRLQTRLEDVKAWMSLNFLLFNSDKQKFVFFLPELLKKKVLSQSLDLDDIKLASGNEVKNLSLTFDQIKQASSFFNL